MKIVTAFLMVMVCGALTAGPAAASGRAYVSANLGPSMVNDAGVGDPEMEAEGISMDIEFELGAEFGIAVGYEFENGFRAEVECGSQSSEMNQVTGRYGGESESFSVNGDILSSFFLANVYYDFKNSSTVTPFLTAGAGFAAVEVTIGNYCEDDTVPAYQVGCGIGYAINKDLTLDLTYRYLATEDLNFAGASLEYSSHNFLVGIRWRF